MNAPIRRLFVVIALLFAALVGSTSWWTVVRADDLNRDYTANNKRDVYRSLKIRRGSIRAADGSFIAKSVRGTDGVFSRRYPLGSIFGHPVGYSFTQTGVFGLESYYNRELSRGASTGAASLLDELGGSTDGGDSLRTTLDPKAQELALKLLRETSPAGGGAIVALDPRDGAVKVAASSPGYDPNEMKSDRVFSRLSTDKKNRPLVNRALQFGYAPGSTMKVVTLAAALDSGKYTLQSQVNGDNNVKISGVPLQNDEGGAYGTIALGEALTKSVNTVFAQVAEDLGKPTMRRYMERFGFDAKPKLDYPKLFMSPSGSYRNGKPIPATSRYVDVGRMGIGQDKLQVTAMQMAQVASAVANDGKLMKPHIGDRFIDADGRVSKRIEPELQSTVMKPETAEAVTQAMVSVVERGTGTPAQIPGIKVAGKTGTAETETGPGQLNKLWFIAFAPADKPRIAIAVTLKDVRGFAGPNAGPVAKQVMQELLKR